MGFLTNPQQTAMEQMQLLLAQQQAEIQAQATISGLEHQISQVQSVAERTEEQYVKKAEQIMGTTRAGYGASGVALSEGSAARVMESQRETVAEDVAYIRETAAEQVAALEEQIGFVEQGKEIQALSFEIAEYQTMLGGMTEGLMAMGQIAVGAATGNYAMMLSGFWG